MINTFKHPANTPISSSQKISILDYGASTEKADNKNFIQDAIDYAATLPKHENDIVQVKVPSGLYWVSGTIYGKSNVALVGNGVIKAINNASFDYVEYSETSTPSGAYTLFAITGTDINPIKNSTVDGVKFDYNGDNQPFTHGEGHVGIAVTNAEDCWVLNTKSENVMYEQIEQVTGGGWGICLFIGKSKQTKVIGGKYWGAGYDAIRIDSGAEDVHMSYVLSGKAKRGAIQLTPGHHIVHLSHCTFDNREGGTSTSHALFSHNLNNVFGDNLTLRAEDGYCITFFTDGNTVRYPTWQSKNGNFTNVVMENKNEKFINLSSIDDVNNHWNENISIQGLALTTEKEVPLTGHVPIYIQRSRGISLDLKIPNISINPLSLISTSDVDIKVDLQTAHNLYVLVSITGVGENIQIHDSVFDAPNTQRTLNSGGKSDNVKIINIKTNTKDSFNFLNTDTNVLLRDCDLRGVQNLDKLRLVSTTSLITDNVLGT